MPGMGHVALPENMAVTSISAFVQMNLTVDSQEVRISNKHGCSWGKFRLNVKFFNHMEKYF